MTRLLADAVDNFPVVSLYRLQLAKLTKGQPLISSRKSTFKIDVDRCRCRSSCRTRFARLHHDARIDAHSPVNSRQSVMNQSSSTKAETHFWARVTLMIFLAAAIFASGDYLSARLDGPAEAIATVAIGGCFLYFFGKQTGMMIVDADSPT